jgi:O-antigen/teichoic acid export membrane protein
VTSVESVAGVANAPTQPRGYAAPTRQKSSIRAAAGYLASAGGGGMVAKLATLVTTVAAARALGPSRFAQYVSLYATADLAAGAADLGVCQLLNRGFAAGRLSKRRALLQALRLRMKTFAVWLLVFAIGVALIDRNYRVSTELTAVFGLASLCIASYAIPVALLAGALAFRSQAVALAGGRWLTAFIALAALPSIGMLSGLGAFAWASLLGEMLTLCLASIMFWRTKTGAAGGKVATDASLSLREAAPFAAIVMLNLLYNRFDVVILGGLSSMHQVSLYAPASRIQDVLGMAQSVLGTVAFPMVSTEWSKPGGPQRVQKLVEQLAVAAFAVSIPVTIVVFAAAAKLVPFILGSQYAEAVGPTRMIIWFLPAALATAPLSWGLAAIGRDTDTVKIYALTGAVAITLHLLLDRHYGAVGGAVASFLREPAALVLALVLARRAGIIGSRWPAPLPAAKSLARRVWTTML